MGININIIYGVMIPFIGTTLGALCVYLMKNELSKNIERMLSGFAAGVMVAASIWSLLIPAMEDSKSLGRFAFMPAIIGFWIGIGFLLMMDHVVPHLHAGSNEVEGPKASLSKEMMLVLAVTLHNIPEGMAVGVVFAGWLAGEANISLGGAFALAIGIAIQNFPEGAIISMPLYSAGASKHQAFRNGVLSGIVEPIGAILTIIFAQAVTPVLPYMLSFAAGAMLYVVVEELIPEMAEGEHSHGGVMMFAVGFSLMMMLDVTLG